VPCEQTDERAPVAILVRASALNPLCVLEEITDKLPDLVIFTGAAVDPSDAEREHLVNCDPTKKYTEMATLYTASELEGLVPTASLVELDWASYYKTCSDELPEIVISTGLSIDPTDPDRERLVRLDPTTRDHSPWAVPRVTPQSMCRAYALTTA
jgi:hypothetical protein